MIRTVITQDRRALEDLARSQAESVLEHLEGDLLVCDMYDEVGSAIYHDITVTDTYELPEIVRLARSGDGPIVELAAGSGRITFALLALGRPVIAVDTSPDMLALLGERLDRMPARLRAGCELVQADMTSFSVAKPVSTLVIGTTSISLLDTDQRKAALAQAHANLRVGGRLIITTVEVEPEDTESEWVEVIGGSGRSYRAFTQVDVVNSSRLSAVLAEPDESGRSVLCVSHVRIVRAVVLVAELEAAGFRVRKVIPLPSGPYVSVLIDAVREDS